MKISKNDSQYLSIDRHGEEYGLNTETPFPESEVGFRINSDHALITFDQIIFSKLMKYRAIVDNLIILWVGDFFGFYAKS